MKYVPFKDRLGICFQESQYWLLDLRDAVCFSYFVKGLGLLFSGEEILYLEGASIAPAVQQFLNKESASSERVRKIALGSSWPKPRTFHVPINAENLENLFILAQKYTVTDMCDRLHVYLGSQVLLDGHDLLDQSCRISCSVEERLIKKFCQKLNYKCQKVEESAQGIF